VAPLPIPRLLSAPAFDVSPCPAARLGELPGLWAAAGAVPTSTDDLAALELLTGVDPQAVLVASTAGTLIGSLIVAFDGWRGAFYRLAVMPEHRRARVASTLVAEGERRLVARGVRRAAIIAVAEHGQATGFWEAAGYRRQADTTRLVKDLAPPP